MVVVVVVVVQQEVPAVAAHHELGPGSTAMLHAPHIPAKPPHPPRILRIGNPSRTFPTQSNPTNMTRQMASSQHPTTLPPTQITPRGFLRQIPPSLPSLGPPPPHGVPALGVRKTTPHPLLPRHPNQYRLPKGLRSCQQRRNFLGLKSHGLKFPFFSTPLSLLIHVEQTTRKTCRCTTTSSSSSRPSFGA